MSKTYRKNILRTFSGSMSRFVAIFAIVALGVGFLAGLLSSSPDIEDTMERYMDGQNLYDFRIVSTLGLTEDDVAAVRAVEGVAQVRGAYSAEVLAQVNGSDTLVARAHSIPTDENGNRAGETTINRLTLVEGSWPQSPDECVVEAGGSLSGKKLKPGDTVRLTEENEDLDEKMAVTEFTVVGLVRDSYYFSYEREPASVGSGSVGLVFYTGDDAFAYDGIYTELYCTVEGGAGLRSMSDEYRETVEQVTDRVEQITGERCEARYQQVRADAQQEIDDAWQEYYDAEEEADRELSDAARQLAEGRDALADGERELDDAQRQYRDGSAELADNESLVNGGLTAIGEARDQLTGGLDRIYENLDQIEDAEEQLQAARARLEAGQKEYDAGAKELAAKRGEYEQGLLDYIEGAEQWQAADEQCRQALDVLDQLDQIYLLRDSLALAEGIPELFYSDTALKVLDLLYESEQQGTLAVLQESYQTWVQAQADYEDAEAAYQTAQQVYDAALAAGETDGETLAGLKAQADAADAERQEKAAARDAARLNWDNALNDAFGGRLDMADDTVRSLAEQVVIRCIRSLPDRTVYEQLKQLNMAKKALDTSINTIIATVDGVENEEQAWEYLEDQEEELRAALAQQILEQTGQAVEINDRATARALLEQTSAQLEQAKATLDESRTQLFAAKAQLEEGQAQLDAAKAELDAGWAQYNAAADQLAAGRAELESARRTLDSGFVTLIDKQMQLSDALKQIGDARVQLADALRQIEEGRATLAEKKQQLLDGEIDYETARAEVDAELADARAKLEDAQAQLDEVEKPEWYIWSRQSNVSFASFKGNVNKVAALAKVFPVFFFLVAALVVLTTMTRMVEEERLQIGTMKALGYSRGAIMSKYLIYSMTAAFAGALLGLTLGFTVFPSIIWYAYEMIYYAPDFATPWRWNYAILSGGSLILCALLATLFACGATLREVPASLMRPRAPKAGKRVLLEHIRPVWRRLSFTQKVTVRNLFRYKKRFWMTVIGVAGCTALLVTGFGISDSISGIITKQYGGVCTYDLMTTLRTPEDTESGDACDYLFAGGNITGSLAVAMEKVSQEMPDGSLADVYLMCPRDTAAFGNFIDLHERVSREATPLGETGVVVTEKLAEEMGVAAGDTIRLKNSDNRTAEVTVTGVCENYVYNYVYLSAAQYEACFGKQPEWNAVLSTVADDSADARDTISARLLAMDEVTSVTFTVDTTRQVLNMLSSIDAVVVMVVVCAALLALVVLYNLSNINIAERVKEIATIKVLGFYDREVNAYVNRESVALTVIGALVGLVLGVWLHRFVIYTVEVDGVMFGRTIDFSSYVYALVLTMLFSAAVNLIMGRKLKKISMVESMKAPE
ncbi:MAG: FtsX-like permease family protein [Gemmiger sp.]